MTTSNKYAPGSPEYSNLSFLLGAEQDRDRLASLAADCGVPDLEIDAAMTGAASAAEDLRMAILEAVSKAGDLPHGWRPVTAFEVVIDPDFEPEDGTHLDLLRDVLEHFDVPAQINTFSRLMCKKAAEATPEDEMESEASGPRPS